MIRVLFVEQRTSIGLQEKSMDFPAATKWFDSCDGWVQIESNDGPVAAFRNSEVKGIVFLADEQPSVTVESFTSKAG